MRRLSLVLALLCGLFALERLDARVVPAEEAKLQDQPTTRFMGQNVAVDGNVAVAIGHDGPTLDRNILVYLRSAGAWSLEQRITLPATAGLGDDLPIALYGNTLVLGALHADPGGVLNAGSAYVYKRTTGLFALAQTLTAPDGAARDQFGAALALEDDVLVVTARIDDDNGDRSGSAYVFRRTGGGPFGFVQKLLPSDGAPRALFGEEVDVQADRILISSERKAYVFEPAGNQWAESAILVPPLNTFSPNGTRHIDISVGLWGSTAVLGWPRQVGPMGVGEGALFVYERDAGGWQAGPQLLYSNAVPRDYVGFDLGLQGGTLAASAPTDNSFIGPGGPGKGLIYARCGATWTEQAEYQASDGSHGDQFGYGFDFDTGTTIFGAARHSLPNNNDGAAYVFLPDDLFVRRCMANPNSTQREARLSASGCNVVAANDFSLHAANLPPGAPGLFYYGESAVQVVFGDGFRCVGGLTRRLHPPGFADQGGHLDRELDLSSSAGAGIVSGATTHFQLWHRDTQAGMTGFNLTDSIEVSWQ